MRGVRVLYILGMFSVLEFHYTIMQWIWVGVNLTSIDAYAVLMSKWYEIARFCYQIQGQHIPWTFSLIWWLCLDLELTLTEIYDITWNPKITNVLRVYDSQLMF